MTDTMTPNSGRIRGLDAVRGVAVMGILAMNIHGFAMPGGTYFNPAAYGGDQGLDWFAWAFNFIFVDSKMRGLFSVLFGASTLLVMERALASSRRPALAHYARMGWLLVFGLIHFYLIWWGDVLVLYAMCGMLLYFFRNLSVRALRRWAIGLLTASFLLVGAQSVGLMAAKSGAIPGAQSQDMDRTLAKLDEFLGTDQAAVRRDLTHYRSDYATIAGTRLREKTAEPFQSFFQFGLETLGLMILGMALFRSGMLRGQWEQARYRRWAITCFAIAVLPLTALVWYQVAAGYDALAIFGASLAWSMPFDTIMTLGWAALVMMLALRWSGHALTTRVAAAGRMAFTNYLTTSIVMTTVFYGYGLGLYGQFGRAALYLVVIAMWAAILAWSKPWLDRFAYGPFEWLWRSLSRFELQPMRKRRDSLAGAAV